MSEQDSGRRDKMDAYVDAMRSGRYFDALEIGMDVIDSRPMLRPAPCDNGICTCDKNFCALQEMFKDGKKRSPEYAYA